MLKTKCFFFLVYAKVLSIHNIFGLFNHFPSKASPLPLLHFVSGIFSCKLFTYQLVENTCALRQRSFATQQVAVSFLAFFIV